MVKGLLGYDNISGNYVIYGNFGGDVALKNGDYVEFHLGDGAASAWVGTTIYERDAVNGGCEWLCTARGLSLSNLLGCMVRRED